MSHNKFAKQNPWKPNAAKSGLLPWQKHEAEVELHNAKILVIDGNHLSRSILTFQLRGFGAAVINQAARPSDARRKLELQDYDIVICELNFPDTDVTGQELLDDLRRAQILPFSTVFVILSNEARYSHVAEAAEAALDCYLLKPHTGSALGERLRLALHRKHALKPIFSAIESEHYDAAIHLCEERFHARAPYWVYAARVGAELYLRTNRPEQAQVLFNAILQAEAVPWARLGLARVAAETGKTSAAMGILDQLTEQKPDYADAYDVMGQIHAEQGDIHKAMEIYNAACEITPGSISRQQKLGMFAFYAGERDVAIKNLERVVSTGMNSRLFDPQSLMLLIFAKYQNKDKTGLRRACESLDVFVDKQVDLPVRLGRFSQMANCITALSSGNLYEGTRLIKLQSREIMDPSFDVEAACNFLTLLAEVSHVDFIIEEAPMWVETLSKRFCSNKNITRLLTSAASLHSPFVDTIRQSFELIGTLSQQSMTFAVRGDPKSAVRALLDHGKSTLNIKLIDIARLTYDRYESEMDSNDGINASINRLVNLYKKSGSPPQMGQAPHRGAGGLSLRSMTTA